MRSRPVYFRAVAALLGSGAAYFLVQGASPLWPLAWLAPAPILAFSFEASAGAAAVAAFGASGLAGLAVLPLAAKMVPVPLLAAFLLVTSAAFTAAVLVARRVTIRLNRWAAVWAFPIMWTAWEHFLSLLGVVGIAYSQVDFPPAIQIAAWAGAPAVTFVVSLAPSSLAVAWRLRRHREQALRALAIPLALCAGVLGWGAWRLAQPATGAAVRVGLAASDETVRFFRTERADEALAVVAAYARRVDDLAGQGAQVVVLPEKFVGVTPAYVDAVRDTLAEAARAHRVWVVAGLNRIEGPPRRNVALVLDPRGEVAMEYDKVHLLRPFENGYRVGRAPATIRTSEGTWGIAICRDLMFKDVGRANARAGAGLLLVPAWDFVADGRLASRVAAMRAVEGGFAVARAAQEGLVAVSDDRGRILAEAATSDKREALLVVDVSTGPGGTLYARAGDWFAWTVTAIAAAILVALGADAIQGGRAEAFASGASNPGNANPR
jgi:apolipoprotein N-acyltransferase